MCSSDLAGFVGGAANAIAGGATLVTFPAMLAAGLPPIVANASNAVAVSFGNLRGAWAERDKLPAFTPDVWWSTLAAVIGGFLGGVLLLATPETVFEMVVPALIGLATLVFAFSKQIQGLMARRFGGAENGLLRASLVAPAALYGGYFGAGLGVVLMAVLSATSNWELRRANALKNVLGVLVNAAAIVFFVVRGVISWPETGVMLIAALAGGYAGGKVLGVVPATAVRSGIILIGGLMTVVYGVRYWA